MSKWVNKDKFKQFVQEKKQEANDVKDAPAGNFYPKWKTPTMGTQEKPKIYKSRLVTDPNGDFYLKYRYHFFQSGDSSYYIRCEKTYGLDKFCPWCFVNQSLWKGNSNDKKKAYRYKRNERFVVNAFILDDPRDADVDDEYKVSNTLRLYEFPPTVESKISHELTNEEEGFGPAIFDPEKGHDLLVKVLAKKPDKEGKIWPDYSLTTFSRKATSIADSEEDIKKIMDSAYDLSEYIEQMGMSWEEHEKLLKQELVWDEVEDEFIKHVGKTSSTSDDKPAVSKKETTETKQETQEDIAEETEVTNDSSDEDISEEDLLKELDSMD